MESPTAIARISSENRPVVLVGGLPCFATYFAAELCRDLLSRQHGTCEIIPFNDLGEATQERIAGVDGPIVLLSEIPDAAVSVTVSKADFPILLIDQAFSVASQDFIEARAANLLDTVRTIARAQIGLNALLEIPRSNIFAINNSNSASDFLKKIAAAAQVDPITLKNVISERQLKLPFVEAAYTHFDRVPPKLTKEDRSILEKFDSFYFRNPKKEPNNWEVPPELLLEATPPYSSAINPLPLVGPARCLSFGPYIYLTAGRWQANFVFAARENAPSNTLGIDITADEAIKLEHTFEIGITGKFEMEYKFDISDSYWPFEFRTFLRRGAIEGEIQILSLKLTRLSLKDSASHISALN